MDGVRGVGVGVVALVAVLLAVGTLWLRSDATEVPGATVAPVQRAEPRPLREAPAPDPSSGLTEAEAREVAPAPKTERLPPELLRRQAPFQHLQVMMPVRAPGVDMVGTKCSGATCVLGIRVPPEVDRSTAERAIEELLAENGPDKVSEVRWRDLGKRGELAYVWMIPDDLPVDEADAREAEAMALAERF